MTAPTWEWPRVKDDEGDLPAFKRLCNDRFARLRDRLKRTQSSLGWINVIEDFGAAGNGVTDDTARIQAAANAANGKVLYFPPGRTYKINGSIAFAGVWWAHKATLQQFAAGVSLLIGAGSLTLFGGDYIGVGDATPFAADGQALLYGLGLSKVRLFDARVTNTHSAISFQRSAGLWVERCEVDTYRKYGILGGSSIGAWIARNRITNCTQVGADNAYAIQATGDTVGGFPQRHVEIIDNTIDTVPSWDGIMCHDCESLVVSRNQIKNVRNGIDVGHFVSTNVVQNVTISDNTIEHTLTDTWGGASASHIGIGVIGYDATHRIDGVTIEGNTIRKSYSMAGATAGGLPGSIAVAHCDNATLQGNNVLEVGSATPNGNGIALIGTMNRLSASGNLLQGAMGGGGIRTINATISDLDLGAGNIIAQTNPADPGILFSGSTITRARITPVATNSTNPFSTSGGSITYVDGLSPEDGAIGTHLRGTPFTLGDAGVSQTIRVMSAVGTDAAAGHLILQGGQSTGSAASGEVRLQVGNIAASGATPQTLVTVLRALAEAPGSISWILNAPTAGAGGYVFRFRVNNVGKADFGIDGGGGGLITGSAAGDWNQFTRGGRILFSTDSGITLMAELTAAGALKVHGPIYQREAAALLHAETALNDGAGAATATLTNAPAATNPTKWIPIDDAGVTRYIPAW